VGRCHPGRFAAAAFRLAAAAAETGGRLAAAALCGRCLRFASAAASAADRGSTPADLATM
jgi:hypothetical protein